MKLSDTIITFIAPLVEAGDYLLGNFLSLPEVFGLGLGMWFLLFFVIRIILR